MLIRKITSADDAQMASIIRQSLENVGLNQAGTAYTDPQLNHLTTHYNQMSHAQYFVAIDNDQVLGGAGFGPVNDGICELQKCYVSKMHRGKGIGKALLLTVEKAAKEHGFEQIYLETSSLLNEAIPFYLQNGFVPLEEALPNEQGHHLMDIWMIKEIN